MTTMTDSKALEVIRANLAPYAAHTEKDRAVEHITARLREPAGVENKARAMFEAQADKLAAPWDRQWGPTKDYWREKAHEALSHQHPAEAQAPTGDDRILWGVVANAGRLSPTRQQRWAHVHDAIAMGSQSSIALCQRFGFDPDDMTGGHDDESGDEAEAQAQGGEEVLRAELLHYVAKTGDFYIAGDEAGGSKWIAVTRRATASDAQGGGEFDKVIEDALRRGTGMLRVEHVPHAEFTTPPSAPVEPYTYASRQATTCAGCGEHKHTPLRIDAMGGYVCLTCIDQKLGSLLGEFGYTPSAPVGVVSAARSSADFLEAYFKACNTSQPRDWHEAACLAKQWHCRIEEALAAQPGGSDDG